MDSFITQTCAFIDCHKDGIFSLAYTFGIKYYGKDTPLLFCEECFNIIYPLYHEYKTDELSIPIILNRHTYIDWVCQIYSFKELLNYCTIMENCILLRIKSQSLLKKNIISDGHEYFINTLIYIVNTIKKYIDNKKNPWYIVHKNKHIKVNYEPL